MTFQKDVNDYELLKDVLLLLALCVEYRAKRYGLHGNGVSLKLTYANMKGITRSRLTSPCDNAVMIYKEAASLLDTVDRRSVRLIGAGIYNLAGEEGRQLTLDDIASGAKEKRDAELHQLLVELGQKYQLDFEGNIEKLYHYETLHKTVEYMRKHRK